MVTDDEPIDQGRFRLNTRKNFYAVRVVKHWNRLPGKVLDNLSHQSVFKSHLDNAVVNTL